MTDHKKLLCLLTCDANLVMVEFVNISGCQELGTIQWKMEPRLFSSISEDSDLIQELLQDSTKILNFYCFLEQDLYLNVIKSFMNISSSHYKNCTELEMLQFWVWIQIWAIPVPTPENHL